MATQSPLPTWQDRARDAIARALGKTPSEPQLWVRAVRAAQKKQWNRSANLSEQLLEAGLHFGNGRPGFQQQDVLNLVMAVRNSHVSTAVRDDLAIRLLSGLETNDNKLEAVLQSEQQAAALRLVLAACTSAPSTTRAYTEYLLGKYESHVKRHEEAVKHFEQALYITVGEQVPSYERVQAIYTELAKAYLARKNYQDYEHNAYWAAHMLDEHIIGAQTQAARAFAQLGTQLESFAVLGIKGERPFDFIGGAAVHFRLAADKWDDNDDTGQVQRAVGLRNQADVIDPEHKTDLSDRPLFWESPLQILKGKDHGCTDLHRHPDKLLPERQTVATERPGSQSR